MEKCINLLNKIKPIQFIENSYLTTKQVADYFEVSIETIKTIVKRNKNKLNNNIIIIKNNKLKDFRIKHKNNFCSIFASKLLLFNPLAVIIVAIHLKDSLIARETKKQAILLNDCIINECMYTTNNNIHAKQLELKSILLNSFKNICKLQEQVLCGLYKIDFVLDSRIAIECDESNHNDRNKKYEKERESYIKNKNYIILRYNPDSNDKLEIFKLINKINKILIKEKNYANNCKQRK